MYYLCDRVTSTFSGHPHLRIDYRVSITNNRLTALCRRLSSFGVRATSIETSRNSTGCKKSCYANSPIVCRQHQTAPSASLSLWPTTHHITHCPFDSFRCHTLSTCNSSSCVQSAISTYSTSQDTRRAQIGTRIQAESPLHCIIFTMIHDHRVLKFPRHASIFDSQVDKIEANRKHPTR